MGLEFSAPSPKNNCPVKILFKKHYSWLPIDSQRGAKGRECYRNRALLIPCRKFSNEPCYFCFKARHAPEFSLIKKKREGRNFLCLFSEETMIIHSLGKGLRRPLLHRSYTRKNWGPSLSTRRVVLCLSASEVMLRWCSNKNSLVRYQ